MGLLLEITVLLLHANLSILIKLASEQQMISWLDFDIVDGPERMDVSIKTFHILDNSTLFLSQSQNIDTIFGQNQEIVRFEQESLNW